MKSGVLVKLSMSKKGDCCTKRVCGVHVLNKEKIFPTTKSLFKIILLFVVLNFSVSMREKRERDDS